MESDDNYENEETSDSEDEDDGDDDDNVVYIDDDEIDVSALPGEAIIDSKQVAAWQGLLGSIKAVPHALARERESS